MSDGGKTGSKGGALDYYGSIAGLAACGPLDFISGVVVDDALVWPVAPEWPAGARAVSSRRITPQADHLSVQTQDPHGCAVGDHVALTGFPQPAMNVAYGLVTVANDAWGLQVATPGMALGATIDYADGWVARVTPLAIGDLRRVGALVYQCAQAHQATPDTAPPNPTYWRQFRLSRSAVGVANPLVLSETDPGPAGSPLIKLTVESHGELYLYWGTPDQLLDTTHENVLAPLGHPPYRDQIVVVLKNFFFGRERATPPNVQIIGGRLPSQSVVTGPAAQLDADGQANPYAVLAELLTHPLWGLGLVTAQFDAASWQAAADWAAGAPGLLYISPLVDRQTGVRQLIADVLAHGDGWVRWNSLGLLEAGHWPHDQAPPVFTSLNTVDENSAILDREIEWSGDGWEGTTNQTTLTFQDSAHAFKERPAQASNLWNRTVRDRLAGRTISRPYVTRAPQALALATRDAQVNAERSVSGPLTVRAETTAVRPGDPLLIRHTALGVELFARCTERTTSAPPAAQVTLQVATERGWCPAPVQPLPTPPTYGGPPRPAPVTQFAFIVLPPLLADGMDFRLTLLAARTSRVTSRLHLWMRQADASAFYELAQLTRFAVGGVVNLPWAPYRDATGALVTDDDSQSVSVRIGDLTPSADLDHILGVPTADAINDDSLLLFLVPAGGGGLEICTVKSLVADGSNLYHAVVRRAGYGTLQGGGIGGASPTAPVSTALTWQPGDGAWFLHRSELLTFTQARIPPSAVAGTPLTFRLAPDSDWVEGDLSDLYQPGVLNGGLTVETTVVLQDRYTPQVRFVSLMHNGVEVDFTLAYATADTFVATLWLGDPQGSLVAAELAAVMGSNSLTWPIPGLAQAVGAFRSLTLGGFGEGNWLLKVNLQNSAGRTLTAAWPATGGDALLKIRSSTSPGLLPPVATPAAGSYANYPLSVTLTGPPEAVGIEFWLTDLGQMASGPAQPYAAPVRIAPNQTLWARTVGAGTTYSATLSFDYSQPPRGGRYALP